MGAVYGRSMARKLQLNCLNSQNQFEKKSGWWRASSSWTRTTTRTEAAYGHCLRFDALQQGYSSFTRIKEAMIMVEGFEAGLVGGVREAGCGNSQ